MQDTTASILCTNGGYSHHHKSVTESKICYGLLPRTALASAPQPTTGASVLQPTSSHLRPATKRQLYYIEKNWGKPCAMAAKHLTVRQASALIDELKNPSKKEEPVVSEPTPSWTAPAPAPEPPRDPRLAMLEGLLPMIPEAMYAVRTSDTDHIDFLRLSRPTNKRNKYFGALKIQTMHGAFGDGKYITRGALWSSGKLSVYHQPLIDMLMVLVPDHVSAALLYAKESKRCCRCNAALTDEISRKYGIGPECVKHWPHIVEIVDEREALAAL